MKCSGPMSRLFAVSNRIKPTILTLLLTAASSPMTGATAVQSQSISRSLVEVVNEAQPDKVSLADALHSLDELAQGTSEHYAYKSDAEKRYHFHFQDVVTTSRKKLVALSRLSNGELFRFDVIAVLQEALSVFRDSHHRLSAEATIAFVRDPQHVMNLGLFYFPKEDAYLIYHLPESVLAALGMTQEQFDAGQYVIQSINGVGFSEVARELSTLLPYKNDATLKTYAGLFLGSAKGMVLLAHLIKAGRLPGLQDMSADAMKIKIKSLKNGSEKAFVMKTEPLRDWTVRDPLFLVENRPHSTDPKTFAPAEIAASVGLQFKADAKSKTYYFGTPSWIGDFPGTPEARHGFYDWVSGQLALVPRDPDATLIIDTRWNRGGDPILWEQFVQTLLAPGEAVVIGLTQPSNASTAVYDSGQGASIETILKDATLQDYGPNSWSADSQDPRLPSEAKTAIAKTRAQLIQSGRLKEGEAKILKNDDYGDLRYSVLTHNPQLPAFRGHVVVVMDRFSFSANTGFLMSMRALQDQLGKQITFVGEKGEDGSGSGRSDNLELINAKVLESAFATFLPNGELAEYLGERKPEVPLSFSPKSFLQTMRSQDAPELIIKRIHDALRRVRRNPKLLIRNLPSETQMSCESLF
jgi:hypothetical protein